MLQQKTRKTSLASHALGAEGSTAASTASEVASTAAWLSSSDAEKWVNLHNYWRCIHGSQPIAWDVDFARGAQRWADRGVMEHADSYGIKPPEGPAGENLASGSVGYMSIEKAVDMWHDENPERGPKCGGHCTAMLWNAAVKLGCGINSQTSSGMLLVCRYGGGNPVPNMGGAYEANVGFPDMSKADECRARHIEGGSGGAPAATPAPTPVQTPGAPTPSLLPGLKRGLEDLEEQVKRTEAEIDELQRRLG